MGCLSGYGCNFRCAVIVLGQTQPNPWHSATLEFQAQCRVQRAACGGLEPCETQSYMCACGGAVSKMVSLKAQLSILNMSHLDIDCVGTTTWLQTTQHRYRCVCAINSQRDGSACWPDGVIHKTRPQLPAMVCPHIVNTCVWSPKSDITAALPIRCQTYHAHKHRLRKRIALIATTRVKKRARLPTRV